MFEIIKDFFLQLVRDYGMFSSFCITVILFLLVFYLNKLFAKKTLVTLINKTFFRIPNHQPKLEEHVIFKKFENILNIRLDNIRTSCVLRKKLFQKIFKIKMRLFLQVLNEIIKKDLQSYNLQIFHQEVLYMIQKVHNDWKEECIKEGVPSFIMDEVELQIEPYRALYFKQIERTIHNSYLYSNNKERMIAIFDILISLQEMILNETEHVLSSFNGELKGKTFCGTSCTDCVKCVHEIYLKKKQEELKELQNKNHK